MNPSMNGPQECGRDEHTIDAMIRRNHEAISQGSAYTGAIKLYMRTLLEGCWSLWMRLSFGQ